MLRDRNPVFVELKDGSIRNGYAVKILNMRLQPRDFVVTTEGLPGALLTQAGSGEAPRESLQVSVNADKLRTVKIFVTLKTDDIAAANQDFYFVATEVGGAETAIHQTTFQAPAR